MGKIIGLFILAILFIPIERIFTLKKEQAIFRASWRNDLVHFFLNNMLVKLCLFIPAILAAGLLQEIISPDLQTAIAAQPWGLQFVEAILISSSFGYWAHRLSHEIPLLWRFHSIHHSIEEMDWLASARLHPLDQVFDKLIQFIPLYFMGFDKSSFGAAVVFLLFLGIFIHCNVRIKFGPLRYFIASPLYHHWHHSGDPETYNKNYSIFPFLDILFGTCYLPDNKWPERYGIREPLPSTWWQQMLYPFRQQAPDSTGQMQQKPSS